jgi:hypothetical protein
MQLPRDVRSRTLNFVVQRTGEHVLFTQNVTKNLAGFFGRLR